MIKTLSVTEASRGFAEVINRARYRQESTLLLKGGKAVAKIIPVGRARTGAELAEVWPTLPHLTVPDAVAFDRTLSDARNALPALKSKWA